MEKNELQKTQKNTDIAQIDPDSPAGIMTQLASNGDFDVDKFGKMLEFQERYEANKARRAFASDFANVQANIAAVTKTKNNPQTNSKYAGLDSVLETSKPVYTEHGFSIIFYEGKADVAENVRVCADVLHKAGHKDTYHLDIPLGGVGIKGVVNMTKIHAKATSITYGRRYLLCMIWNIPTQDDDGAGADKDKEPAKQKEPTTKEQNIITQVAAKLSQHAPKNKVVDEEKLANKMWMLWTCYPNDETKIAATVKHFINYNLVEAVCKDMDGKAEFKWQCKQANCGLGFDDPGGSALTPICPNTKCLSPNIEMVVAE